MTIETIVPWTNGRDQLSQRDTRLELFHPSPSYIGMIDFPHPVCTGTDRMWALWNEENNRLQYAHSLSPDQSNWFSNPLSDLTFTPQPRPPPDGEITLSIKGASGVLSSNFLLESLEL
jgi:hypothetical protein